MEGIWTGLGLKLHCSCSPVEGNVPFLKQQPCCSRKESHLPLKEIINLLANGTYTVISGGKIGRDGNDPKQTFILKQTQPYVQCNWEKGLPQLVRARLSVQEALMGDLKVSTIRVAALNIHGVEH